MSNSRKTQYEKLGNLFWWERHSRGWWGVRVGDVMAVPGPLWLREKLGKTRKEREREREREKGNFQDRIFQLGPGNDPPSAREPRCRVARFYRVFLPGFSAPVPANRFFLDPTAIYRVWVGCPKVYRVLPSFTEFYPIPVTTNRFFLEPNAMYRVFVGSPIDLPGFTGFYRVFPHSGTH